MQPVPNAVPQFCPTARELDDLELLTTGALAPITRFGEPGSPVTLTLPPDLAADPAARVLPAVRPGTPGRRPGALIRPSLVAAAQPGGAVVAVPLAAHGDAAA